MPLVIMGGWGACRGASGEGGPLPLPPPCPGPYGGGGGGPRRCGGGGGGVGGGGGGGGGEGEGIDWGGDTSEDYTKLQQTIQSSDRLYKAPTDDKAPKSHTKIQRIRRNRKTLEENPKI